MKSIGALLRVVGVYNRTTRCLTRLPLLAVLQAQGRWGRAPLQTPAPRPTKMGPGPKRVRRRARRHLSQSVIFLVELIEFTLYQMQ